MGAILVNNYRIGTAAWRKVFKREWKLLQSYEVDPQSLDRPLESIALDDVANNTDSETDIWEEGPEYVDEELDEAEELDDSDDENLPDYSETLLTLFDELKDLVHEQKSNTEFLKRFVEGNLSNFTLLDEIKHLKAQRSMSKTWSSRKHSELLFYKRKES
ncbi:hypothetical protein K3495_g12601 [Podosphaera aphanis]|nr:hypothetical protein K3495_g12601 [Podosphaera aphanis]